MKKLLILSAYLIILFTACESEEIISPDMGYEELLVIQCELNAYNDFPGVRVTKTIPVGVPFSIEQAEITDATLYLKINGVQIIPLHYTSQGLYKPLYNFTIDIDDTYELFGERNEQTFYARTIIPKKPIVISASYNYIDKYAEATVECFNDEAYSALWVVSTGRFVTAENFYSVSSPVDSDEGEVKVRTSSYPANYQTAAYNNRRYIQVFAFDSSFEDYFRTSEIGGSIDNPYVQGSGNTIWNVKGTKVIGMFIGVSKSEYIFVN